MAVIGTEDGHTFAADVAWDRIQDHALVELAYVARDLGNSQAFDGERAAVTSRAYHALADAATTLRLLRHGNDRIREARQAEEMTPEEAAAAVDTRLEEALEAVLVRYAIPLRNVIVGHDRGDFASDLAAAARSLR